MEARRDSDLGFTDSRDPFWKPLWNCNFNFVFVFDPFLARRFRVERKAASDHHLTSGHGTQSQPGVLAKQLLYAPAFKLPAKRLSHYAPMVSELTEWTKQELF